MTSLDPSHLPWRGFSSDPTSGAAVHTSVRRPADESVEEVRERAARSPVSSSSDGEGLSDDEAHDAEELKWIRRRRAEHKLRRRQRREEILAQGRLATLPLPDLRFEQSYLMSIQPFIHSVPSTKSIRGTGAAGSSGSGGDVPTPLQGKPPKTTDKDKRRKVEESFALVEDPADSARQGLHSSNSIDALFAHGSEERSISIDWNTILYVTLRDQVLSPLIQGALWAMGGILLGSTWNYLKTRGAPRSTAPTPVGGGSTIWERLFGQASLRGKAQRM